jgi:DNA-binding winged helix-turn-helix (wHTH) protein
MEPHHPSPNPIRFGIYEVDQKAGELHKNGVKLRLQGQPFQVLVMLLEQHGQVVAREELREKVWPGHTFVDFDQGLNTAINKIREALGDSATNPRFVETVPRRGYRFIAPVEGIKAASDTQDGDSGEDHPIEERHWWDRRSAMIVLLLITLVAGGAIGYTLRKPAAELPLRKFSFTPAEAVLYATVSPDGKHIAYTSGTPSTLWILDLDSFEPRQIEGTEGARWPLWSPDSQFVAIVGARVLRKVTLADDTVTRLCDLPSDFAGTRSAWLSHSNSILVGSSGGTSRFGLVPARGGEMEVLPVLPLKALRNRNRKPDLLWGNGGRNFGLYLVEQNNKRGIAVCDMESGSEAVLPGRGVPTVYSSTGHLIGEDLVAYPISSETLAPAGDPFQLAQNAEWPSVSDDGTLVYIQTRRQG